MKDNFHNYFRQFNNRSLEQRLVFGLKEKTGDSESASTTPTLNLDDEAAKRQEKGKDFLKSKLGQFLPIDRVTITDVQKDGETVSSVTAKTNGIEVTIKESHTDEQITAFKKTAMQYATQFSEFRFRDGSTIDIDNKTSTLVVDLGTMFPKTSIDGLTVTINTTEDTITGYEIDPKVENINLRTQFDSKLKDKKTNVLTKKTLEELISASSKESDKALIASLHAASSEPGKIVQEVTFAELDAIQKNPTLLKDKVGTTYKLKNAAIALSFTVQENNGKQISIVINTVGGKTYTLDTIQNTDGDLSVTTKEGTTLTMRPTNSGHVNIEMKGNWQGDTVEGTFSSNKEGETIFNGKVDGKKLVGTVDTSTGLIEAEQKLFRSSRTTEELKTKFEGFFGTIQDLLASLMQMLEETGLLDMLDIKLNEYNDPDKRMSLFVMRNKLGPKNTALLKNIDAKEFLGMMAGSTEKTIANLQGAGFEANGETGSALMKVIARVNEARDNDNNLAIEDGETFAEYIHRTGMIDKNGLWTSKYRTYDPKAEARTSKAPEEKERTDEDKNSTDILKSNVQDHLVHLDPNTLEKTADTLISQGGVIFRGKELGITLEEDDHTHLKMILNTPLEIIKGKSLDEVKQNLAAVGMDEETQNNAMTLLKYLHAPETGNYNGKVELGKIYGIEEIAENDAELLAPNVTIGDLFVAMNGGLAGLQGQPGLTLSSDDDDVEGEPDAEGEEEGDAVADAGEETKGRD